MSKLILIILCLLITEISSRCVIIDAFSCQKLESEGEVPEELDSHGFQTPPRNDALGNYLSTYQDMRYLVGWISLQYNSAKTRCTVTFNAIVNPDLGEQDTDYYIYYTFGDMEEQESNEIVATSRDDSYPNGLSVSCRIINMKTGNEVVSLQLQNVYFLWDNYDVDTPEEYKDGQRGAIVELFGWAMEDIGEECGFLGIAGYLGVKIFSPYESILSQTMNEGSTLNPWWYGTQVVSYKYDCRSGNQKQFKKIVNRCRAVNVRVYAEIVVNHMTGDSNDMNPIHYNDACVTWGPKTGSGGSPFYTQAGQISNNYYTNRPPANEYPSVPYLPSDFHCGIGITDWDDPLQLCYGTLAGLQDLNTEKEYVQRRIATYIIDLISLGVSGVAFANGRHIPNISWAKIFRYTKEYLGNKLPLDFLAIILVENADMDTVLCSEDENLIHFGAPFTALLKSEGFKDSEIQQIKLWFKGNLAYEDYMSKYDASCGAEDESNLIIDLSRWTVGLEYSDDINMGHEDYNIYIREQDIQMHKNILINDLFLQPRFNWAIRFVFTSYSIKDVNGMPDGKSEKSYCASESCIANTVDLPFKRAFNPYSTGYDCGDKSNWIIGEYSRIHRDIDIVNAMREWTYSTPELNITEEELYTHDRLKAQCDEKCLICNEESKLLDRCIFCNSNLNYYPVMEAGGREEYYECHKRDERVERLYFSNKEKAFLPCYETCRYCEELGDINNHKCTLCDYNLAKKPGTKDSAKTFNCVTSCSYSYYYTESGQYKCTNTPVCPQDKNIYIVEKNKCVSSCKEEAPYIYLFNGNCVQECQSGYIPDDVNNLCRSPRTSECTMATKSESLATLYSASMLNSFAKSYKDEYMSYTSKHVTKITNPNYNIYIFNNFDCVKSLNLDIPDLRRVSNRRLQEAQGENVTQLETEFLVPVNTCYTDVQTFLGFDDPLIVVYIEDISNLIADKGYLLYNPRTGYKTDYVNICKNYTMMEKEDVTADEEGENKFLKYIYLRPATQNADESGPSSCEEGKAPLYRGNMIDYSKCLEKEGQFEGIFYDPRSDMFIPCHENCKYCIRSGSSSENNCQECAEGYIKHPLDGRRENYNCVAQCTYSYFFSSTGVYTCTPGPTCPQAYRYEIKQRKQCIDACKNDDVYVHTFNGKCVIDCPEGYIEDDNKFCIEKITDASKCSSSKENATLRDPNNGGDMNTFLRDLDTLVKNYFEEFYYTDRHVSEYNSKEYNILIYEEKSCLTELNLNFPVVDFGDCYAKVQNETGLLNNSLIVVLMKKLDQKGKSSANYSLYSPTDGTKLDAGTICKDQKVVVEESVLDILEQSGLEIDYESIVFLTDQNIDIFDSSGAFYTDICYDFDSPIDRDITLEDRLETFYPNISLCDEGCQSRGVNLTTMKAICSCTFNDISSIGDSAGIDQLNEVIEIISSSNIQVLKCMKFMFKRFGSSVGGFLMIFCIIIVISMAFIFYYKDKERMKNYIVQKTTAYINYLNEVMPEEEDKKTNILINSIDDKVVNDSKAKNKQNSKIDFKEENKENSERKGDVLMLNKNDNNSKEALSNHNLVNNLDVLNKVGRDTNYYEQSIKEDFKAYLAPNIDDQEFEDILLTDKRTFKEYFLEALNDKQLFVNTFNVQDNFLPNSVKIAIFVLTLILYTVINGFFYGEDEISKIYHIEGDDPFFGFFPRSITRYIYSAIVGVIVGVIIDLFFVQEKKMKGIFNREKRNIVNLKVQITKLSKEIEIRYICFFVFEIVLFILLMFYLLCFNYVYPHTQGDWVKSSIFLIIIMQILSILVCLLQTGLRFLGFYYRSEKLFKLSKLLD